MKRIKTEMERNMFLLEWAKRNMIESLEDFKKWKKEFEEMNKELGYNLTNYEE